MERQRKFNYYNKQLSMRNLDEIKKYLSSVGHDQFSIQKIEGFLIGKGLLDYGFEMEYAIGDDGYVDFINWFEGNKSKFTEFDLQVGSFIHVCDSVDVMCMSDVVNNEFVGTDGCRMFKYKILDMSRPCTEREINAVCANLAANGIQFDFSTEVFEPITEEEEQEIQQEREELEDTIDELFDVLNKFQEENVLRKGIQKVIDDIADEYEGDLTKTKKMHDDAFEALGKILNALENGDLCHAEKQSLEDALGVMIELGAMYE